MPKKTKFFQVPLVRCLYKLLFSYQGTQRSDSTRLFTLSLFYKWDVETPRTQTSPRVGACLALVLTCQLKVEL